MSSGRQRGLAVAVKIILSVLKAYDTDPNFVSVFNKKKQSLQTERKERKKSLPQFFGEFSRGPPRAVHNLFGVKLVFQSRVRLIVFSHRLSCYRKWKKNIEKQIKQDIHGPLRPQCVMATVDMPLGNVTHMWCSITKMNQWTPSPQLYWPLQGVPYMY